MNAHSASSNRYAAAALIVLTLAGTAPAEAPRAPGSNTGDGSTPFTGLAQAPEANLFVGAATTAIPIEVPPGRQGLTPQLALGYSSSGGPSPYGYGWDLPLGRMQRATKRGVLSCTDASARNDFVLVVPGATVECTLDPGAGLCTPRVEEAFMRIRYSSNQWDVWDKSGLHYVFGVGPEARAGSNRDALFLAGSPCVYTFLWALSRIEDPNGNYLEVQYLDPASNNGVLHPDVLRYGGNQYVGPGTLFEVDFVWSDEDGFSRPAGDEVVNSTGGFPAKLTKLLSRIVVRYLHENRTVRSYRFWYEFQTDAPDRNGRQSFLSAVTLFDGDSHALPRGDGLPASTTFLYRQNDSATEFGFAATGQASQMPDWILAGRETVTGSGPVPGIGTYRRTRRDILDMNGDGIADLVDITSDCQNTHYWKVYLGTPAGFNPTPIDWYSPDPEFMCGLRYVSVSGSNNATWFDTVDLTGDGIPDWVDGTDSWFWKVYEGFVADGSSGGGFNPTALLWITPGQYLRRTYGASLPGNPDGSKDDRDLIDMNGDGLLDVVDASARAVWFNTGSGFEAGEGTPFPFLFGMLRFTAQTGTELIGLYDVNGDGLPDQIRAFSNRWDVYLNDGHGLSPAESWDIPSECGRKGMRDVYNYDSHSPDVGRDFIDINGDGLPDVVDVCGWTEQNPYWKVYLNRGSRFSTTPYYWRSPRSVIRDRYPDQGEGAGFATVTDTFDVDGDGLVDFVDFRACNPCDFTIYHNAGGAWCPSADGANCADEGYVSQVAPNPSGARPGLLEQMENGIGGATHLEYRPSTQWTNIDNIGVPRLPFVMWTLTHIDQHDGLCDDGGTNCVSAGSHELTGDLTYAYGLFDSVTREFYGFGTVEQFDADGNLRTTWFHQEEPTKGRIYAANSYAAGPDPYAQALVATLNAWDCVDRATGQVQSCPQTLSAGDRWWVRLRSAARWDLVYGLPSKASYTTNNEWDAYGNVTHATKGGSGTTSVHTYTSYAVRDDASGYIVDKPAHVRVADSATQEEKWFVYDNLGLGQVSQGNATTVFSWLDQVIDPALPVGQGCPEAPAAGIGTCVTAQTAYDGRGNLSAVTGANGASTWTEYDSATQIFPYIVTNALGHRVATLHDPACSKVLWQTVPHSAWENLASQARTVNAYDTFCRLQATALPDENIERPHREYVYFLGAPQQATDIRTVQVATGSPLAPKSWIVRDDLFDALGRRLQTQRDAVVDGKRTCVADATVTYDSRGNPAAHYSPFVALRAYNMGAALYVTPPADSGAATLSYDALGRVTHASNPDGSFRTFDYTIAWQTTAKDECYNAGCPGAKTIEKHDAFGRVIEKQVFDGDTFVTRTGYTHDALGRLRETKQGISLTSWATSAPDTRINVTYDSLGRKILMSDPDSGTWKYGYDLAGNLISQDDPKTGQHIEFCYDELHRVRAKHYRAGDSPGPSTCENGPTYVAYGYDEGGGTAVGRLTGAYEVSDWNSTGATTWAYDIRGRTTAVIVDIDIDGRRTSAVTRYTYDAADHPTYITYPDGEVVRYLYDSAGQLKYMKGAAKYIKKLTYDVFGRPRVITHGNRVIDTRTYSDRSNNFRLRSIAASTSRASLLSYTYTDYLPTGLLAHLADNGPEGPGSDLDNTATFTYDALGRLTGADGPRVPYANAYAYDALGNMILKEGTTLTYSTTAPHTLTEIDGSSTEISHDANGNRNGRPGHIYAYDADDRLTDINAGTVRFVYNYAGRRVAKINGTSETRYYSNLAEVTDGWLTKYYYAGGMLVASQRVAAPTALAAASSDPPVRLAGDPGGRTLQLVLWLRPDIHGIAAVIAVATILALLTVPGRRRPVVGIAIRRGPVLVLIIAFAVVSVPVPISVRPAWASHLSAVMHYHLDHLGSPQLITDRRGRVVTHIRYKPYGEVRTRYTASEQGQAAATCSGAPTCREFTGYETEPVSGLQYAGARFYDPTLGMFLTHDPAREYANPYTYVGWDPVNGTDPNGECELVCVVVIALVATFVASAIDAGVRSGDVGTAFKAGALSIAATAAGPISPGLQLVAPKEFGQFNVRDWAISQVPVAGSAYGAARSFENGNYATGVVGATAAVYQAFGVYQSGNWSTPGQAATSVGNAVTTPFIGDNFGAAWRGGFADILAGNFKRLRNTDLSLPASWADALSAVPVPANAGDNGMHAWHAGTNTLFARSLGIVGAPFALAAGVLHESPLDWVSFKGEQGFQGSVNHFLDSSTDIVANGFGAVVGYSKLTAPTGALVTRVAEWGNYIPGPGEPDPAFGGGGAYRGNPADAWGQYP